MPGPIRPFFSRSKKDYKEMTIYELNMKKVSNNKNIRNKTASFFLFPFINKPLIFNTYDFRYFD
ncbi:hypothetical protein AO458_07220 [Oenococcus oeni]|nr:hypothetical protein AAX21_00925 [Oenococcus oeni]OIL83793.1 hypothetical protein ATX36_02070 [Oenococcus oeni]OIL94279.1 hypothetical protein ATX43_02095 [Oenococcus oeni]PDH82792.1 hypothetical protein AO458_07220 [Oenococcus oeni]